jgi:HAMP domain-containing protein
MNKPEDADLRSVLAHHDVEIGALATRVAKVEQTIEVGFAKVTENFGKLEGLIVRQEARQGPGMGELINGVAKGGAIVAMTAGAITVLVSSIIAPQLTKLEDAAQVLSKDHADRISREQSELAKLREDRHGKIQTELSAIEKTVEDLKERFGWTATVHKQRGS